MVLETQCLRAIGTLIDCRRQHFAGFGIYISLTLQTMANCFSTLFKADYIVSNENYLLYSSKSLNSKFALLLNTMKTLLIFCNLCKLRKYVLYFLVYFSVVNMSWSSFKWTLIIFFFNFCIIFKTLFIHIW